MTLSCVRPQTWIARSSNNSFLIQEVSWHECMFTVSDHHSRIFFPWFSLNELCNNMFVTYSILLLLEIVYNVPKYILQNVWCLFYFYLGVFFKISVAPCHVTSNERGSSLRISVCKMYIYIMNIQYTCTHLSVGTQEGCSLCYCPISLLSES